MTQRLYLEDSWRSAFEARVLEVRPMKNRTAVVLDQTAFYPESGGQMADRGTLGDCQLVDVQVAPNGDVLHFVEGTPPDQNSTVSGRIDMPRRRVHMALHTGQHVLSRALIDIAGADTVSSRLGESGCNIDIDKASLDDGVLGRVEDLANAIVDEALPVKAFFPSDAELASLELRRPPKVSGAVRVVKVGDFDVTPCGGTHCTSSAQIGFLHIISLERQKQQLRILFAAGKRARDRLKRESAALHELAKRFTCGPHDVATAIDKLQRNRNEIEQAAGEQQQLLAQHLATELSEHSEPLAAHLYDGLPADLLRAVARQVTQQAARTVVLATRLPAGLQVVVSRSPTATHHCGQLMKQLAAATGGRGGGRPDHAEGRLPADSDWTAALRCLQNDD